MKELDFLPLSFHQAIARRREHRRNMALSVALVLAMGVLHVVNNQRINSAQASLAALRGASGTFQNAATSRSPTGLVRRSCCNRRLAESTRGQRSADAVSR
jgi:hypothetical protein